MTTDRDVPITREEAKAQLALWVEIERGQYAGPKWEEENDALQEEVVRNGEWVNFPFSYLQRCRMGLDQPAARQALGKVITSCSSLLERAIEIYGDMPQPGVSSTEGALPWIRDPEPDVEGTASPKDLHFPAPIEVEGPSGKKFLRDVPPTPGLPGKHGETRTGLQPGTYEGGSWCASPTNDPDHCTSSVCREQGACLRLHD